MKNSVFLSLFALFAAPSLFSQEYQITGVVKNSENTPLPYANVLLLKSKDSTVLKGTSSDEMGKFEITSVAQGNYFLTISYLGNRSPLTPLAISADEDLGDVFYNEEAQALDEVVVISQKPKLERKVDRLVFSIANTSLADNDIWNVLKRTPSVVVIGNELSIKGSKNIGVMINDRMVNLPQEDIINLLSGTSASNVESVEVITNPPAKYSAEGGMLINIKMNRNLISGYNGAIFNRYEQGVFAKHSVGTDHYFKGKKADFSVNYTFNRSKDLTRYTDATTFVDDANSSSIWTAEQEYTRRQKRHNLSAFFDYEIDERNHLGLSTINMFNPDMNRFYNTETIIEDGNGTLPTSFVTTNDSDQDLVNSSFYLDWTHKLKKEGAELSANAHYTYYDSDRGQDLETDFFDGNGTVTGENDFTTRSMQQIDLYNVQLDYITPLGNSSRFETGLRYAGIDSESSITQQGFDRTQPGIDPTEAGVFKYDESIYAAYVSMDSKWDKWRFKTGLRAEYTETLGDLDIASEPTENNYLELFPSFSLDYTPNKKHRYNLYYYRRIERPRYNRINPFQIFQSNNSVIEGNPNLLPATRNYIAAGYTYDRTYTVEFFYKNQKNQNQELVFQDNESNLLRFLNRNLIQDISYGIDIWVNKDITNFWYTYIFFAGYYREDQFSDFDSGQLIENGRWTWFARANNSFSLLRDKSLAVDVDFIYYSPIVDGNAVRKSWNKLDLSLRKTLWNKKASISMGIADILNQANLFESRSFLDQNNSSSSRPENRLFTLGFRYKFGNTKIRDNQKSKRVDERNRI